MIVSKVIPIDDDVELKITKTKTKIELTIDGSGPHSMDVLAAEKVMEALMKAVIDLKAGS